MKRILAAVLGMALFAGAGSAYASVGPRIIIHPHVGTATYDKPLHDVRGRVGIFNTTNQPVTIRCSVVATLRAKSGTDLRFGSAIIKVTVGPDRIRRPHYEIILRDKAHEFMNRPSNLVAHCSKV